MDFITVYFILDLHNRRLLTQLNPLTPKGGRCLICPYSSTAQSSIKGSTSTKGLDCLTNSSQHYHRKCMENSVENIHVDIRVEGREHP